MTEDIKNIGGNDLRKLLGAKIAVDGRGVMFKGYLTDDRNGGFFVADEEGNGLIHLRTGYHVLIDKVDGHRRDTEVYRLLLE